MKLESKTQAKKVIAEQVGGKEIPTEHLRSSHVSFTIVTCPEGCINSPTPQKSLLWQ